MLIKQKVNKYLNVMGTSILFYSKHLKGWRARKTVKHEKAFREVTKINVMNRQQRVVH